MSSDRIAVLGAGNAGRAMAAYLTLSGRPVSLYNRWAAEIEDIESGNIRVTGWTDRVVQVDRVTTDIAKALDGASLVCIVVPAFAHRYMAEAIAPYLNDDQTVLVHPGLVGGALAVGTVLRRQAPELRVPVAETFTSIFACRLRPGGVHIRQVLDDVSVGVYPAVQTDQIVEKLNAVFGNRLTAASNVLETSMNNRNPVYHCPTMLANIARSEAGEELAFANAISPGVLRLIEGVDAERFAIGTRLGVPVVTYYESLVRRLGRDEGSLDRQIKAVFLPGGASPLPTQLSHRYVSEDVPFGLVPWMRLGAWLGVQTPVMEGVATTLSVAAGMDYLNSGLQLADLGILENDTPESWAERL